LFEAQAAQTPDAIALTFAGQQMSYCELNRRANQLAHYLQRQGVGPDVLVGLCMHRSMELIVGLLAILKAGGAYVALDPTYPAERLAFMLADTQVPVVLAQQHLVASLPSSQSQVLCLDTASDWLDQEPTSNPTNQATPTSLAYVSYTSGSTGTPKGVCVPHQGVVRLVRNTNYAELTASDVFLQLAPIPFDASTLEVWGSLLNGARLVIMSPQPPSLAELGQVLRQEEVSILWLTAGLFHLMIDEQLESLCQVRQVLAGGDVLSVPHVRQLLEAGYHGTLINGYGPTENTTFSCCYPMTHADQVGTTVPIGRPIANTQAYLLDRHLQPVPIGVVGELYFGGDGLAHGYLNRPELTAEKFIPNPFVANPGVRMYRTGDLARYRIDGTIEFLGRIDHQIKIRGFRIELGEIEAVLGQHPGVRDVTVVAKETDKHNAYDKRLIAYVVQDIDDVTDSSTFIAELRAFLQVKLPTYMVPSAFVLIDALPLTLNGKVDRHALPAPEAENTASATVAGPRTPEETLLVKIWAETLGHSSVGIYDDFFALGGHSLLAARLIARVNATLDREIPLRRLFEAPTVAAFAQAINNNTATEPAFITSADLAADIVLDPSIAPPLDAHCSHATDPQAIFLTGVTGFLGAFLLNELLTRTGATIYCLVRAADTQAAGRRIEQTLRRYQIWRDAWRTRIVPVVGDLCEAHLGMDTQTFQHLSRTIDVIYHAGAEVNYLLPYHALKAANVQGTVEVLRLACQERAKPVHYVSSIAVAMGTGENGYVREADELGECTLPMGYAQSKWVAEGIMQLARARGLPVAIYRPGRISGHSQTGVANQNDFFMRLLTGCMQLGLAPELPLVNNLIPVDYVASAIIHLSQQPAPANATFHLLNPEMTAWLTVVATAQELGYALQTVPYQEWYQALIHSVTTDSPNMLHSLLSLIPADPTAADWLDELGGHTFSLQQSNAGLAGSSLHCPVIDPAIIECMLTAGVEQGLFEAPALIRTVAA
jgi:amino acid adenylation domain-containing protein/thioester reductase-like protein